MGQFSENFDRIVRDLKESNYFRIWLVLWLVCLVLFFVAFGILAERSRLAAVIGAQTVSVQREDKIQFPRFHVRYTHPLAVQCTYGDRIVPTRNCQSSDNTCVTVLADEFWALNIPRNWSSGRIVCNVLTANITGEDHLIAWELEGSTAWGPNEGASIWIGPNAAAWVLITKDVVQYPGSRSSVKWERVLLYHSSLWHSGNYSVSVVMDSFDVDTITTHDNPYTGWMALGDMGGVAFFLVILHTIVMTVVGLLFANTSSFLKPGGQEYNRITT